MATPNPLGHGVFGQARYGDENMVATRGLTIALPLSYTISPSKYAVALPLSYTVQHSPSNPFLLYYVIAPTGAFAINGDSTIISPDRITYAPRPVTGRTLLAEPIIQGYKVMNWVYSTIEPDKWAYLVAYYNPQNPTVLLTFPSDRGFWEQKNVRMLPPTWGSWETMLVSGASLAFVIPSAS
jgi:hypothetical protein